MTSFPSILTPNRFINSRIPCEWHVRFSCQSCAKLLISGHHCGCDACRIRSYLTCPINAGREVIIALRQRSLQVSGNGSR